MHAFCMFYLNVSLENACWRSLLPIDFHLFFIDFQLTTSFWKSWEKRFFHGTKESKENNDSQIKYFRISQKSQLIEKLSIFCLFSIIKKLFLAAFMAFTSFSAASNVQRWIRDVHKWSSLNQRCSEMFITESNMTTGVEIKVGWCIADHRWKPKSLSISEQNYWLKFKAHSGKTVGKLSSFDNADQIGKISTLSIIQIFALSYMPDLESLIW